MRQFCLREAEEGVRRLREVEKGPARVAGPEAAARVLPCGGVSHLVLACVPQPCCSALSDSVRPQGL